MKEEKSRFVLLEECEHRILGAFRRGLEATCSLARDFRMIRELELYQERNFNSFTQYVQKHLQADMETVNRIERIGPIVDRLLEAGLKLPANESQAAELSKLKPEKQPQVWKQVLIASEKTESPITVSIVRKAVALHEPQQPKEESDRPGVMTALDLEGETTKTEDDGAPAKQEKAKVPERLTFSEKGEAALERVGRLCGKSVREAIEKGNLPISERDLLKWSQEEDSMVQALKYYIVDQRWKVDKAIQFENRNFEVKPDTTMAELVTRIKARGGRLKFEFEGITFNAVALAAA
jgi:hypothetical protein